MIDPEDLSAISEALAPALEQLLIQTASQLRAEFAETLGEIINQLELLAGQIISTQNAGTQVEARAEAYRRFVVDEAKALQVKPSELRGHATAEEGA